MLLQQSNDNEEALSSNTLPQLGLLWAFIFTFSTYIGLEKKICPIKGFLDCVLIKFVHIFFSVEHVFIVRNDNEVAPWSN
jgi:hypothetical protein